jgi:hypothetical protein
MPEDLSPFFAGLDAQRVTFKAPGGDRLVQGYFDNAFINADLGEAVLDTTAPRFTCRASEVAFLKVPSEYRGMDVLISGVKYSLIQVQPEGTGLATVSLAHEEQ